MTPSNTTTFVEMLDLSSLCRLLGLWKKCSADRSEVSTFSNAKNGVSSSIFKCRVNIGFLVLEPNCAVGNGLDIDLFWQLSGSNKCSPSDLSYRMSRHFQNVRNMRLNCTKTMTSKRTRSTCDCPMTEP